MGSIAAMNLWQRIVANQATDSLYRYQTAIRRYLHNTAWLHEKEKYATRLLADWRFNQHAETYREMLHCWRDTEKGIETVAQIEAWARVRKDFPNLCALGDFVGAIASEEQLRQERVEREMHQNPPTQQPALGDSDSAARTHQRGRR